MIDIDETLTILKRDYHEITEASCLGDVILLLDHTTTPLHSMVSIAEDIVFTKNGISDDIPWSLGRFGQVADSYISKPRFNELIDKVDEYVL